MVDVIHSVQVEPLTNPSLGRKGPKELTPAFRQLLIQRMEEGNHSLRFSSHAMQRLVSREINLTPYDLIKIDGAVERAKAKGAKESLVLLGDLAFLVSVENKTVITALVGSSLQERVFTHIDSAVIA